MRAAARVALVHQAALAAEATAEAVACGQRLALHALPCCEQSAVTALAAARQPPAAVLHSAAGAGMAGMGSLPYPVRGPAAAAVTAAAGVRGLAGLAAAVARPGLLAAFAPPGGNATLQALLLRPAVASAAGCTRGFAAPGQWRPPEPDKLIAFRKNGEIRAQEVRLVWETADGRAEHEVMPLQEALSLARRENMDLVEVSPGAHPPVAKLADYDSYVYQARKRDKEAKKREVERRRRDQAKEVQFRPFIAQHDLEVKLGHVNKFLEKGYKVKLTVRARGYKERIAAQETLAYLQAQMDGKGKLVPQTGPSRSAALIAVYEPLA